MEDLFNRVVRETGLPEDPVRSELRELLGRAGVDEHTLTLDELRRVLADYLQDVLLDAQEKLSS
jgi:hypothetical protein